MKKEFRIKKSDDIQKLMSYKSSVGNRYFVLYHHKNHDMKHFRFAISVPKKYGNAVKRNQMKRRIREIVRLENIETNTDFFIIAKLKSNTLSFEEIKINLKELLLKVNILKGGKA